jgi:hypothetical protein
VVDDHGVDLGLAIEQRGGDAVVAVDDVVAKAELVQ